MTNSNIIQEVQISSNYLLPCEINNNLLQIDEYFEFIINPLRSKLNSLKKKIKEKEKILKEKEEEIEELDKKCSICFTNKSNIIFIPCGHLCMCNNCNKKYNQYNLSFCPICRSNGNRYEVYQ